MIYYIYLPDFNLSSTFFYADDDKDALKICLKLTAFFQYDIDFQLYRIVRGVASKVEVDS